jgi:RHS repeat-associated protein
VAAISDGVAGFRGDRDMVYDALDRLTDVVSPMYGTIGAHYSYDVLDNLTSVTAPSTAADGTHAYCYDAYWRLTNVKAGTCSGGTVIGLGYDVQGNLVNKSGVTYAFDYGNRLRAGGPETYRYDAQGRRVRSNSSAGLIYSLYTQSGQLLFQRDERNNKRRQYIYLNGSLVAEHDRPLVGSTVTVTYQHTDALGSPVATTSSAKVVLQRSEYEPYGYLLNRPMQDGPGYTGHVTDAATGLVYMQQRYYDPVIGRDLSVDPVTAYDNGDMRFFNRYAYAFNNPYKFNDPDGRCPSCVGALFGAGLDLVIQVAEIGMGSRTEIDGTSILISAGTGALGVGLAGKVGRIGSLVVDAAISAGSTAAKGDEVTVGGVVADVAFGRAGGAAAEKAILKTAEQKIAQRQVNRLERIGNKPGARDAQKARAQNAGPALQRSVEQKVAQASVVSAAVGSAAEKQLERKLDEDIGQ